VRAWSKIVPDGKPAPIQSGSTASACWSARPSMILPDDYEGTVVEVAALRGVIGRLMRKDALKARLVLSVNLIGQAVSVEVDAGDVKAY
jgi:hypothetical protein